MAKWKTEQLAKIGIDYGIVYVDYGETSEFKMGVTRGGATFEAMQELREIEFDGRNGKTKGMQARDYVDAHVSGNTLSLTREGINFLISYAVESGVDPNFVQTVNSTAIGVVADDQYFKNLTMFIKTKDGEYKKITMYNPMNEANFTIPAPNKGETEIPFDIYAHWESDDSVALDDLFKVEEVATIS